MDVCTNLCVFHICESKIELRRVQPKENENVHSSYWKTGGSSFRLHIDLMEKFVLHVKHFNGNHQSRVNNITLIILSALFDVMCCFFMLIFDTVFVGLIETIKSEENHNFVYFINIIWNDFFIYVQFHFVDCEIKNMNPFEYDMFGRIKFNGN